MLSIRWLIAVESVIVMIVLHQSSCARGDELPTAEDVISGYQQNAAQFRSASIKWQCELRRHEPYRKAFQSGADAHKLMAADANRSSSDRSAASASASQLRSMASAFRPGVVQSLNLEQYRRDGAMQFRVRNDSKPVPSGELNGQTLVSTFRETPILARTSEDAPWCLWQGTPGQQVMAQHRGFPASFILAPPFLRQGELEGVNLHPIDAFFTETESMVVVGQETLEGHSTIVVEKSEFLITEKSNPDLNGRVLRLKVTRAWLDPARGFLPRRISGESRWFVDGNRVEHPVRYDVPIPPELDDVEITEIPGAGFFPTRGRVVMASAFDEIPQWPGILEVVDGKKQRPLAHIEIIEEIPWTATATGNAPDTVYDLQSILPSGSLFVNVQDQRILAQDDQGNLIRARADQLFVSPSRGLFSWQTVAMIVGIGVFLVLGVRALRRRAKS